MSTEPKFLLKSLYQALSDRPLLSDDPYYIPYMQEDLNGLDPVAQIQTAIEYSSSESLQMVSGQRGTGKSTELSRLKSNLEDSGYVVFHIDMLNYIHTAEPVDISDFLLASTLALAEAAERDYQLTQVQENYFERLKNFLGSEIELEDISIKADTRIFSADIKTRLKRDDSFRRKLQKHSQGHISRLVADTEQFITELVTALREKTQDPDKQVTLIIDSFEQIRGTIHNANDVHNSIVRLFSTHGKNLRFPMIHMVITVPPYLNSAAPGVATILGATAPINWPSIHVRKKTGENDETGINILIRIISKRTKHIDRIFKKEDLHRIAINSGGDLRHMFAIVKDALVINGANLDRMEMPIPPDVITQAEDKLRRSMMPITDDDVMKLSYVQQSKQAELADIEELPELARLFDFNLIINYRNGDDWYDIHPLVADYVKQRKILLEQRKEKQAEKQQERQNAEDK